MNGYILLFLMCLVTGSQGFECKNSGQYTDAECDGWKGSCHSDKWQDFMFKHCQETCGFCNPASCVDKLPDRYFSRCQSCEKLAQNGLCDSHWSSLEALGRPCAAKATGLVKESCRKSCNTCECSDSTDCPISMPHCIGDPIGHCYPDDPDYCHLIDCTKSESLKVCPVTCNDPTEPSWCQGADCSYPEVKEKCKDTCSEEDCIVKDDDQCLQGALNYADGTLPRDGNPLYTTKGGKPYTCESRKHFCDDDRYNIDLIRCCPVTCQTGALTEIECDFIDGSGHGKKRCIYPNEAQCYKRSIFLIDQQEQFNQMNAKDGTYFKRIFIDGRYDTVKMYFSSFTGRKDIYLPNLGSKTAKVMVYRNDNVYRHWPVPKKPSILWNPVIHVPGLGEIEIPTETTWTFNNNNGKWTIGTNETWHGKASYWGVVTSG